MNCHGSALRSSLLSTGVNSALTVSSGIFYLIGSTGSFKVKGKIQLVSTSSLKLVFEGKIESCDGKDPNYEEKYTLHTDSGFRARAYLSNFQIPSYVSGTCDIIETEQTKVTKLIFGIYNLRDLSTVFIKKNKHSYLGRMEACYQGWDIIIDKRHDTDFFSKLNKKKGYGITHVGCIRRIDKSFFEFSDVEDVFDALHWLLSFYTGREVSTCVIYGFLGNKIVWKRYMTPRVENWQVRHNWMPVNDKNFYFDDMLNRLICLRKHKVWSEQISKILSLYLSNFSNVFVENRVVIVHTALEMFAWTYLVMDKNIMSKNKFRKCPSHKIIRKLLEVLRIPYDIPFKISSQLADEELRDFGDGVGLFVSVRNDSVHPERNHKIHGHLKHDVLILGIQFLELCILSLLDYKGNYLNLLREEKWIGETKQKVPWVH